MRYTVIHKTTYQYAQNVSVSHHVVHLTPRPTPRQRCLSHTLQVDPKPAVLSPRQDYFGNAASFISLEGAHRALVITAESLIEVTPAAPPLPAESLPWEQVRDLCQEPQELLSLEASQFALSSQLVPDGAAFRDYAEPSFPRDRPILAAVVELNERMFADFKFDPKATTVATPLDEVVKTRRGVCQDFAHFQIACLRALRLPARYVSGYLETKPPPGKTKLTGSDASHAWTQVWGGDLGWVDVDPTNNLLPNARHITLGWGRDYSDVCPIRGVIVGGGEHRLSVAVDVLPEG